MTEIKRYDVQTKIICRGECGVVEDAGGPYLLASDIDAEHLKTAINALTAVAIFDRFNDKPKEAIVHLSALLAAVRKV